MRSITETQTEIDAMDMEQAAKAKRQFEDRYNVEKRRETEMQSQVGADYIIRMKSGLTCLQYAHIGGELSSIKDQVKTQEKDMREFKDIHRRYKDQLVKVKVPS